MLSFPEFIDLFDDPDWGFGILDVLSRLERCDSARHHRISCSACSYPVVGPWFRETSSGFSLCSLCYSQGRVPASSSSAQQPEFRFKEYRSDAEAMRDRLCLFRSSSSSSSLHHT
jgi:hypothetical protein